jgi:hypothetical protein
VILLLSQESKAFGKQEFWGLNSHTGFRELNPLALLPAQENKACGQREFTGPDLLCGPWGVQFCRSATCSGEQSMQVASVPRPDFLLGFTELSSLSSVVLLLGDLSLLVCTFCYLWNSGRHETCLHQGADFPGISG